METKKTHGGARQNAGRKPAKEKRNPITFRLTESEEIKTREFIKTLKLS